jgi:hypothetical protein
MDTSATQPDRKVIAEYKYAKLSNFLHLDDVTRLV